MRYLLIATFLTACWASAPVKSEYVMGVGLPSVPQSGNRFVCKCEGKERMATGKERQGGPFEVVIKMCEGRVYDCQSLPTERGRVIEFPTEDADDKYPIPRLK